MEHFAKKISKWAGLDFFFPNDLLHSSAAASSCPDNVTAVRKESCEKSNENTCSCTCTTLHIELHSAKGIIMLNLAVVAIAGALLPAAVAWPLLSTAGCERQVAEVTMQEEV